MNQICPKCGHLYDEASKYCRRCRSAIDRKKRFPFTKDRKKKDYLRRFSIFILVCSAAIGIFYSSLVFTASPLSRSEKDQVDAAVRILESSGFINEAYLLRDLAVFRSNDNWLNASVPKENAFAATNYPFAIITLYPDFFAYPEDDIERAAILLHEARHLKGYGEDDAYEFVWRNRKYLGWTNERYGTSVVWQNIRRQTRDYAPNLFVCDFRPSRDCTEIPNY